MNEEDDSMEDSMLEEEIEDEESSSESVDEELKLTKNFIDALNRIQSDNLYDDYILLVSCVNMRNFISLTDFNRF